MLAFRHEFFDALGQPNPESPKIAARLWKLVEEAGKESGPQRRRALLIVRLLVDGFRRALARSVDPAAHGNDPDDTGAIVRVAEKFGPDELLTRLERCLEADMQIDRKVQLVLVVEGLVDSLIHG